MGRYIFDKRSGVHVIDLAKSLVLLRAAGDFLRDVILAGKDVLFVGTKKQAQDIIKEVAQDCEQHYVCTRWLGGTLTNRDTIRRSVKRLRELEALEADEAFATMHKKEAARLRRELEKLRRNLSGVANMASLPGAVVVIDVNREAIAVNEANRLDIPVVAMLDTNCDPDPIDYPIPGNDDAMRAIRLVCNTLAGSIKQASVEYARIAAELNAKKEAEEEAKKKAAAEAAAKAEAAKAEAAAKEKADTKKAAKAEKKAVKKAEKKPAKKTEEKKAEPKKSEAKKVEAKKAEPKEAEPKKADKAEAAPAPEPEKKAEAETGGEPPAEAEKETS
jgi:small subunit ribosomal protein S2